MTEEQYTRCPSCKTVFRVTDAQLALRDGVVRCGHCKTIFDGRAELISLAPQPVDENALPDEAAMGPPTVTLRSSQALRPAPDPADEEPTVAPVADEDVNEPKDEPDVDYEHRFAWDQPQRKRRIPGWAYVILVPLLLLLLAGQVLYHFRDALAAHWPGTRPMLTQMCVALSCEVRPLRDVAALSIDASDLQVDPAHVGLLILSFTFKGPSAMGGALPRPDTIRRNSPP